MNLEDREDIMKHWDRWRKYIADGGKASWPRDAFESLLDGFQEKIEGRGSGPVHNQVMPGGDLGQMDFKPGQLYLDSKHCFSEESINMYYLLLSRDLEDDEKYWWRVAKFIWCSVGFKGALVAKLTDDEVEKLKYIGNLNELNNFGGG